MKRIKGSGGRQEAAPVPVTETQGPGHPVFVLGTQHTMSDVVRATGLSLSHVSRIFGGKRTPKIHTARAIAKVLGVGVDELYERLEGKRAA